VSHELAAAIGPLVQAIGASVVPVSEASTTDVVLHWKGSPALAVRVDINDTLAGLIASIEAELGGPLGSLDRVGKQIAVRILDERGAFAIRRAIEEVADAMGVSRITIYNYLNVIRDSDEDGHGQGRT
jgi:hypothetical protein